MFPTMTTGRPTKRSLLRELVREAIETAAELATLGEAGTPKPDRHGVPSAPTSEHPHRRPLRRRAPTRRPGPVAPREQVCVTPVHRPARRH
jgi:hypothetical protein